MKQIGKLLVSAIIFMMLSSCTAYKGVAYFQDSQNLQTFETHTMMYDAKIMPKDLISIVVSTTDPKASIPFNLTVPSVMTVQSKSISSQPSIQQYLVENDGTIDFPVLGEVKIGGLTKSETEKLLKGKLKSYLKEEPIINVRMTNYKISVMGEVANPGTFTISNEKVSVLEALAMAGDLTVYGLRDNIKLIREDVDGKRHIIELNINKSNFIESPYYYLQQNDVLYVTPNKTKAKNAGISNSTTIWFSVVSTALSVITIIVSILL